MIKTVYARRFLLRPYLLSKLLLPAGLLIWGMPLIVVGQDRQADQVKSSEALDSPTLPDTQENRIAAAERYLKAVPSRDVLNDTVAQLAESIPPDQRDEFKKLVLRQIRANFFDKVTSAALSKHFTADEINALASFYGTPRGQSIMRKFSAYAADAMPPIQQAVMNMMDLTNAIHSQLQWTPPAHELIAGLDDKEIVARYVFTNSGARAVTITSVDVPTGFDAAPLKKKTYLPGETGSVTAAFTVGDHTGFQGGLITVKTDDPDEPTVRLLLTVNIPEILKINPRFVYWKTGDKPEPKIIQLTVPGEHHVKISGIKSSRTVFDATLVSQTSTNYEIRVTPATTAQPANGKITIMTSVDSTSSRQFEIFTRIIPLEDCWLEKETRWSGRILWLDSQLKDDFYCDECHMPDALYLNQAEWNAQIEAVINAWSPGTPTVVYCVSGCRSSAVTARLGEYGLQGLFFIVRSQ